MWMWCGKEQFSTLTVFSNASHNISYLEQGSYTYIYRDERRRGWKSNNPDQQLISFVGAVGVITT